MEILQINEQSPHISAVRELWRANSSTLGFFPEGAFADYAARRHILVAVNPQGQCVGYLLYRASGMRIVISHLCVHEDHRRCGTARFLFENLKTRTSEYVGVRLNCRRDFPANKMWRRLGFYPIREKAGRGQKPRDLTTWLFDYGQPTLFSIVPESKSLAVLDCNVLFDLQDPPTEDNEESKALEADWFRESTQLCLTDETYAEIDRQGNKSEREKRRAFASNFTLLQYDHALAAKVFDNLRPLFPSHISASDVSDLNQLAKAIAAGAQFFVTRDDDLLELAQDMLERWEITVVRPCKLIVLTDESVRQANYRPARLAGSLIHTKRLQARQIDDIVPLFQNFERREPKSTFVGILRTALALPNAYQCSLVVDGDDRPIGFFVLDRSEREILKLPVLRIQSGALADTVARHLVWRAVALSVEEGRSLTLITDKYVSEATLCGVRQAYFVEEPRGWMKINLHTVQDSQGVATELAKLPSNVVGNHEHLENLREALTRGWRCANPRSHAQVELLLWPAKIVDSDIPCFIVPIKPQWAMHLFDESIASQTLVGSDPNLALNVENVYYRVARPRILSAPGRVLWYVSQQRNYPGSMHLRACSYVNEIAIGSAKEMFRRFRRLGVYQWNDLERIVPGDNGRPVMAFSFSHTELFWDPVPWSRLQEVLQEKEGTKSQIQSPLRISRECFTDLYKLGTASLRKRDTP